MPFREGLKPNQPFTVSKAELSSQFRVLSAQEVAELGGQDKPKPTEPRRGEKLSLEQAETIIGKENFFGPVAVEKAFGITLEPEHIPEIPFSKADLEGAKELGQFLVLRTDKAPDGAPLTMLKMHDLLQDAFTQGGKGKVLYSATKEWKTKSAFFTTETPRVTWALASRTTVPDSKGKNYLKQTELLAGYLTNEVFKNQTMPPEYQSAIHEFDAYYDRNFKGKTDAEITQLLQSDWGRYAQELSELTLNELTRQSPVDALYDMLIHFQNTGKKILKTEYTLTNRRSSGGWLVSVGNFVADGVDVGDWKPDDSDDDLGVSFSRSL